MKYTIKPITEDKKAVEVTFEHEGVEVIRDVNAVFDEDGVYNEELTELRVEAVAMGVINKIALGLY